MTTDVLGIGFGPSNLALAIALAESEGAPRAVFLEQSPRFSWHRGMLLPGTTMQISFLKDLATLRNPQSAFTFVNYLQMKGRLHEFVNRRRFYPSRREFHDYLEWAASFFKEAVKYSTTATNVLPVYDGDRLSAFDVESTSPDGARSIDRARTIVLASGLQPRTPAGVEESERVWHSSRLMTRLAEYTRHPGRIVVVGAGQSAAEATAHLHEMFSEAEITAVLPRYGYSASDDSPLVNRIFDPPGVDHFYDAPLDVKQDILRYHANSNYSVVDRDLIEELHGRIYEESVMASPRLRLIGMTDLLAVDDQHEKHVRLNLRSRLNDEILTIDADLVVLATGYHSMSVEGALGAAALSCCRDARGNIIINRDFSLQLKAPSDARVYVQGGTESTHGITASLLSTVATRAGDIADALTGRQGLPAQTTK